MMQGENQPPEPTPHLAPALAALILVVGAASVFGAYARSLEARSIAALAADEAVIERDGPLAPVKNQGSALQIAALEAEGLLPIYGSSELNLQADYNRPFHATVLFRDRPTGFTVFPVGKAATTSLIILQKLAASGPDALRGRKIAISLSPLWFFERLRPDGYSGNFSPLHAGELAFEDRLSFGLRQEAARRMIQYPETLANRPLLRFALENLADGSPLSLACYDAVLPLGWLHNAILRQQDHWNVVGYLWKHPPKPAPPITADRTRGVDWPAWYRRAEEVYRPLSTNNEFGIDNRKWDRELRQEMARRRNTRTDETFLRTLRENHEWGDLDLLLRELNELGAEPMLLSMPIHGGWYDRLGVSSSARRVYYEMLREVGARHRVAVVDFADHDADRSFCHDHMGHLSPIGLVHYDQALDGFYRGAIAAPATADRGRATGAIPGAGLQGGRGKP